MHTIGRFLGVLFREHPLPTRSGSTPLIRTHGSTSCSLSHDFTQLLHYCPHYSQSQLIQTLVGVCSGVPEAFEVFRCRPSTTEGELTLFLKRAVRHSLRCIVLEVNNLPFKLQEVGTYTLRNMWLRVLSLCVNVLSVVCNNFFYYSCYMDMSATSSLLARLWNLRVMHVSNPL